VVPISRSSAPGRNAAAWLFVGSGTTHGVIVAEQLNTAAVNLPLFAPWATPPRTATWRDFELVSAWSSATHPALLIAPSLARYSAPVPPRNGSVRSFVPSVSESICASRNPGELPHAGTICSACTLGLAPHTSGAPVHQFPTFSAGALFSAFHAPRTEIA